LQPHQVVGLSGRPPGHVREFGRCPVGVACLQMDGFALEAAEQLLEFFVRH
jgi:hypothetical protein